MGPTEAEEETPPSPPHPQRDPLILTSTIVSVVHAARILNKTVQESPIAPHSVRYQMFSFDRTRAIRTTPVSSFAT